jgi:uncharacterized DUF497 family protein
VKRSKKITFEWDQEKDQENQVKHQVSFSLAQRAFFDPLRIIAEDISHGSVEERFFVSDGLAKRF